MPPLISTNNYSPMHLQPSMQVIVTSVSPATLIRHLSPRKREQFHELMYSPYAMLPDYVHSLSLKSEWHAALPSMPASEEFMKTTLELGVDNALA